MATPRGVCALASIKIVALRNSPGSLTTLFACQVLRSLSNAQLRILHGVILRFVLIIGRVGLVVVLVILVVLKRHIEGLIHIKLRVTRNLPLFYP